MKRPSQNILNILSLCTGKCSGTHEMFEKIGDETSHIMKKLIFKMYYVTVITPNKYLNVLNSNMYWNREYLVINIFVSRHNLYSKLFYLNFGFCISLLMCSHNLLAWSWNYASMEFIDTPVMRHRYFDLKLRHFDPINTKFSLPHSIYIRTVSS